MSVGIAEIRARAVELIEAATPDVDPAIGYHECSYEAPLEEIGSALSRTETMRGFHVLAEPVQRIEGAGSSCTHVVQPLVVRVRYDLAGWDRPELISHAFDVAYSDQARIAASLRSPPAGTTWAGLPSLEIDLASATPLTPVPTADSLAICETRFRVRYQLTL